MFNIFGFNIFGKKIPKKISDNEIIAENNDEQKTDGEALLNTENDEAEPKEIEPEDNNNKEDNNKAKKKRIRKKRSLIWYFFQGLASANAFILFFILLASTLLVGLRYSIFTPKGRDYIVESLNGLHLPPVGNLYLDGLEGDLLTDFTLKHAYIKDSKGIWIEGYNLHARWDFIDLFAQAVDINDVKADKISFYRLPVLERSIKSEKDLPVSIKIDNIDANIETYPALSKKYGYWNAKAKLDIKRSKDMKINGNLQSLLRSGDKATVNFEIKKGLPISTNIEAVEAKGGALGGLLGLNANEPLYLKSDIMSAEKAGSINVFGKNGNKIFSKISGQWGASDGSFSGFVDLSASDYIKAYAGRLGNIANINANWTADGINKDIKKLGFEIASSNVNISANGVLNVPKRKIINNASFRVMVKNLGAFTSSAKVKANGAGYFGALSGDIKKWNVKGVYKINSLGYSDIITNEAKGSLAFGKSNGDQYANGDVSLVNARGNANFTKFLGANPNLIFDIAKLKDNQKVIKRLDLNGQNIALKGSGGVDIFGNSKFNAQFITHANAAISKDFSGNIVAGIAINQAKNSEIIKSSINAFGQNLKSNNPSINKIIGNRPEFKTTVSFVKNHYAINDFEAKGADFRAIGTSFDKTNPLANLGGSIELGNNILDFAKLKGKAFGNFSVKGITQDKPLLIGINLIGNNVSSENKQLMEYLGKSPNISGNVIVKKGTVLVSDAKLSGAKIFVGADGQVVGEGGYKLLSKFYLKGPVNSGKFQANGNLAGNAKINGSLDDAKISLNVFGNDVSSNNKQLMEYLGNSPKASGNIIIKKGTILISDAQLNGAKAFISADGQVMGQGGYKLASKWYIKGPINVGQVEAKGNLLGDATIIGPQNAAQVNINSKVETLNIANSIISPVNANVSFVLGKEPFNALIKFNGKSQYGPVDGQANLYLQKNETQIKNINIKGAGINATGDALIANNTNPEANLNVNIKEGILLKYGNIAGNIIIKQNGKVPQANIKLAGNNFAIVGNDTKFTSLAINGNGALDNLNLATNFVIAPPNASSVVSFVGNSLVSSKNSEVNLTVSGAGTVLNIKNQNDRKKFLIQDPLVFHYDKDVQRAKGKIGIIFSQINNSFIDFDLNKKGERVYGGAELQNFGLGIIQPYLSGTYNGKLNFETVNNKINASIDGAVADVGAKGIDKSSAINGKVLVYLRNNNLELKTDLHNQQGVSASANTILPVINSVKPLNLAIIRTAPISGQFAANGDVRPISDLIFVGERILNGNINTKGTINGTINKPDVKGDFALKDGSYYEPSIGLAMKDLTLSGLINSNIVDINNFSANDGHGGSVSGTGKIITGDATNSDFNVDIRKFRLVYNDTAKILATGKVKLVSDSINAAKLSGNLRIDNAQFAPKSLSSSSVAQLEVEEINLPDDLKAQREEVQKVTNSKKSSAGKNIELAVNLYADRGIFIRGSGLNLELSLNANVGGDINSPTLGGVARVFRGQYSYGGRTFEFEENGSIKLSANPNNIRLNLLATRQASDIVANISVTGTATDPKIELSSTPSLPSDEVLSQVLFGRFKSQLSSVETVQLASSLAALAGGNAFDVVGNLRQFANLDSLVFGSGTNGELTVAGGKYIGRNLYLQILSAGTLGITTSVEWQPTKSTAIASSIGQLGDAKISIRWRHDFK